MTAPTNPEPEEVLEALEAAIRLMRHYAQLLNMHDGGERKMPEDANAWIARRRELQAKADQDPDPWQDRNVKDAINDGRNPSDIQLLTCPRCVKRSYWNEGSHFTCRFCQRNFEVLTAEETPRKGFRYVRSDTAITLADCSTGEETAT